MKNILLSVISVLFFMSCENNPKKETKQESNTEIVKSFDWLIGKWKRSNDEEGKETFEIWHKINRNEYKGWGYSMINGDTLSKENITLAKINNNWKLAVITKEENTPTYFNLIKSDKSSFTCENNEIDFPNKIEYWKEGRVLMAKVSSSDLEIEFFFNRIKGKVTNIPSIPKNN